MHLSVMQQLLSRIVQCTEGIQLLRIDLQAELPKQWYLDVVGSLILLLDTP